MPSQALPGEQPVADVAGRRRAGAAPSATARRRVAPGPRARRRRPPATSASATSGIDERTGDGSASSTTTVRTTCTTCPAERSQATARSPRPTSLTSRPWLTPRWTSPTTPPGSVDVEELRPVVRRHRSGQRQVDAEAAGHDPPPPGAAHGGQQREARRRRQRRGRRPCGCRRGTGRCRGARPGRPSVTAAPREAGPRPRSCPARSRAPDLVARGQDQQVGVVHGDRELPGGGLAPAAGARRRRSRRPARPPARTRRRPSRRTTPPRGRPRRRRGATGSAGRGPRPRAGRTPRRRRRRRPGRAGGRRSVGAALVGVERRGRRGRRADPPGSARRDRRPTASAARGSPRRRRRRPARPARRRSAGRAAPRR